MYRPLALVSALFITVFALLTPMVSGSAHAAGSTFVPSSTFQEYQTCTTGCGGPYPHTWTVTNYSFNTSTCTGTFSGTDIYNGPEAYHATFSGTINGNTVTATDTYVTDTPSYPAGVVDQFSGTIDNTGVWSGNWTRNDNEAGTFTTSSGAFIPFALSCNGNSTPAHACQNNGYQQLTGTAGETFANTGECVSYAAHGGTLISKSV